MVALSNNGGDEATGPAVVAELAEVDALPGAEVQAATRDGNGQRDARQHALRMGGHAAAPGLGG